MRTLLTLLQLLLTSVVFAQTTLYNQGGISLSYTTSTEKTVFCKKESKTVHFVKLHYTVANNSGQAARINSYLQMCNDAFANCLSEDEVFRYEGQGRCSFQDGRYLILKSGDSYFGDVGNWYYQTTASPCSWSISPEFAKAGTTLRVNIDLTPTNPKKNTAKPTYGISQQEDVINNPKPKVDYAQKQIEQDNATDNAMKAWQNSYKDNQNQINKINSIPNKYQLQPTQQEKDQQARQQAIAQAKLDQIKEQAAAQQQRYEQTQIELDNAKNVSMNAYQEAINNGRKESGALLESALSGGAQISDPTGSLIYTGVGLGVALFTHLSEKKAERKEKEVAAQKETEKIQLFLEENALIIDTKTQYIKEAMRINQYTTNDLISKPRFAALLVIPKDFSAYRQKIYFTSPVKISKYSDSTYPLKDYVETKLLMAVDKSIVKFQSVYTLYPITDVEIFVSDFVKKMGSGTVINIDAQLLDYLKLPFEETTQENTDTDFWGDTIKKDNKKIETKPIKKDNRFWEN